MRILLVEDDVAFASALQSSLHAQGMLVDIAGSLAMAREALKANEYRILLLDRQLPDGDGADFVGAARAICPDLPILILTAKHTVVDRIRGLDAGADDYLSKPFDVAELMARIRAISRRPAQMPVPQLEVGRLTFDFVNRHAEIQGVPLALPRRQLLVLEALCMRVGRTVSRAVLEEAVYGFDDQVESNALESHVSRLRRAVADADVEIHTLRGLGYLLKARTPADP